MKTVLITDDSKTSQMLVQTTLQRLPGLTFMTAANGNEALKVLSEHTVDLLVTDINMPEMDGIELVRNVRQRHDTKTLPILIITAKGQEEAREQGMTLGANAYILKPLSGRELTELTQKLLAESSTRETARA